METTLKLILSGLMATLASTGAAIAGAAVYVPPVAVEVSEPPMRAGSGAWLIPLAIIAILALTLTGGEEEEETPPTAP